MTARFSPEARYAVYLVDPGPDRARVVRLLQEVLGVSAAGAAECLRELPSVISFVETEQAARALAERFREAEAVAVVRPAGRTLGPAPVEPVRVPPVRSALRGALLLLAGVQGIVCVVWLREGRALAALFGFLLALCAVAYAWLPRRD